MKKIAAVLAAAVLPLTLVATAPSAQARPSDAAEFNVLLTQALTPVYAKLAKGPVDFSEKETIFFSDGFGDSSYKNGIRNKNGSSSMVAFATVGTADREICTKPNACWTQNLKPNASKNWVKRSASAYQTLDLPAFISTYVTAPKGTDVATYDITGKTFTATYKDEKKDGAITTTVTIVVQPSGYSVSRFTRDSYEGGATLKATTREEKVAPKGVVVKAP